MLHPYTISRQLCTGWLVLLSAIVPVQLKQPKPVLKNNVWLVYYCKTVIKKRWGGQHMESPSAAETQPSTTDANPAPWISSPHLQLGEPWGGRRSPRLSSSPQAPHCCGRAAPAAVDGLPLTLSRPRKDGLIEDGTPVQWPSVSLVKWRNGMIHDDACFTVTLRMNSGSRIELTKANWMANLLFMHS